MKEKVGGGEQICMITPSKDDADLCGISEEFLLPLVKCGEIVS